MAVPKAAPIDMTPVASAPAHVPGETYVVKPGDSLYAIAARHKVKLLDLQNANSISDVRRVKPGMVLKLPSGVASAQGPSIAANTAGGGETVRGETRIVRIAHSPPASTSAPAGVRVLNGDGATGATNSIAEPTRVAAADTGHTASDAAPIASTVPATAASGKLRWPVKGRIVQGFGQRADGSHNDGIDISVPAGTDVMAAEAGVVAYAGSEVKTYGNLVLIRHDNGWVTAYAYNEKLLVQRGDRVRRGQLIAKAGKSGGVDQPQLHFEIRVGSRPVDPTGYLEKM